MEFYAYPHRQTRESGLRSQIAQAQLDRQAVPRTTCGRPNSTPRRASVD